MRLHRALPFATPALWFKGRSQDRHCALSLRALEFIRPSSQVGASANTPGRRRLNLRSWALQEGKKLYQETFDGAAKNATFTTASLRRALGEALVPQARQLRGQAKAGCKMKVKKPDFQNG